MMMMIMMIMMKIVIVIVVMIIIIIIMIIIIIKIIIIINDIDEVLVIPSLEADHATNLPKENMLKSLYAKTRPVHH